MYFCWLHPCPCHFLSVLCWHWVPWLASAVRSHFPSLQWVRHSLLSPPFPTPPFLSGGGLGRGRRELGAGVHVWYKGSCLLAFALCSSLPTLAQDSPVLPRLCVLCASSQGRRWSQMGGGLGRGDGDSWADSGPLGRRAG